MQKGKLEIKLTYINETFPNKEVSALGEINIGKNELPLRIEEAAQRMTAELLTLLNSEVGAKKFPPQAKK